MELGRGAGCAPTCTPGPSWCEKEPRVDEKERRPGQTLLAPQCSAEHSQLGLPEQYEDLFIKVGG